MKYVYRSDDAPQIETAAKKANIISYESLLPFSEGILLACLVEFVIFTDNFTGMMLFA